MMLKVAKREDYERLSAQVVDSPLFTSPAVRCESLSSSISTFLEGWKDIFWGMRWLLLEMQGTETGPPALAEFSRAAKAVLDRRIRNHPTSARWRIGWHKRCDTYRKPLV